MSGRTDLDCRGRRAHQYAETAPGMSADHAHGPTPRSALVVSITANSLLLVAQVLIGVAIGSLALLADSLHNASDVVALVIALIGQVLVTRPPTDRRTYGY